MLDSHVDREGHAGLRGHRRKRTGAPFTALQPEPVTKRFRVLECAVIGPGFSGGCKRGGRWLSFEL